MYSVERDMSIAIYGVVLALTTFSIKLQMKNNFY